MRKPLIFVSAFVLLFASAFLAIAFFTNTGRIWKNMLKSVEELGSAHVSATILGQAQITTSALPGIKVPEENLKISALIDGDFEWRDPAAPLLSAITLLQTKSEKESNRLKGEARYRDRTAYIRLREVPESMRESLGAYKNTWVELGIKALPKEFNPTNLASKISVAERKRLAELLLKHKPFKISKNKRTEKIGGKRVYHLVLVPERERMKNFLRSYSSSESALNDILKSKFEVWVGVWDHNLYKFSFTAYEENGLELALTLIQHNEPVLVQIPELAKSPEEAKKSAAGSGRLMPSASRSATSTGVEEETTKKFEELPQTDLAGDADRDGLSDALEAYYGSNPRAADSDGDGVSDGEEVNNAQNPNGPGGLYDFGLGQ